MPFNYSSFINEISILINEAEDFSETDKVESSAKFRSWRHKTLDFIYQIESKKYNINSNLAHRHFKGVGYWSGSSTDLKRIFETDLRDSVNELKLLVENFNKYGDPHTQADNSRPPVIRKVEIPEKVTLRWMIDNLPITVWLWLGGSLCAASAFGFWFRSIFI